jgi:Sodium/hydrogen exchanger family
LLTSYTLSIGFQVPFAKFGSTKVLLQGLFFVFALLGKVGVGFMVPNFWATKKFRMTHLRDCLVVGFSMAAEGEFAFVIAVFAVSNGMIDQELYASVVLAVLASTIVAPFCLETSISYFNKQAETTVLGEDSPEAKLEKGIRERTAVFFAIQTKSAPGWGLQTAIVEELTKLNLDVIDHRSWHPRQSGETLGTLLNEVYVKDDETSELNKDGENSHQRISDREAAITNALSRAINQIDAVVKVERWFPEIAAVDDDDKSISEHILDATSKALQSSMRQHTETFKDETYSRMDDIVVNTSRSTRRMKQIQHLDAMFKGRLEGLFRRDNVVRKVNTFASDDGEVELLDNHGVGTGRREQRERFDVHGFEY